MSADFRFTVFVCGHFYPTGIKIGSKIQKKPGMGKVAPPPARVSQKQSVLNMRKHSIEEILIEFTALKNTLYNTKTAFSQLQTSKQFFSKNVPAKISLRKKVQ